MASLVARVLPIALVLGLTAPPPLAAQQAPPTILIVDMQQILEQAKAAKQVSETLNQQFSAYSKEVAQQEDELQKGGDELKRQQTVLSPEIYTARATDLQQRYDKLGKAVQAKRQALQASGNEAMDKVKTGALEVIADIVKERKAGLVLQKQAVAFETEGMDVTAEAIQRLDKKLPTVTVNLPKPEDAAPAPSPLKK